MFNRHHIFMIGAVLLFLGIQFRMVESVVLNEDATQFLAENFGDKADQSTFRMTSIFTPGANQKTVTPPNWVGWLLLSAGIVLVLHALAMPKPGS